MCAAKGAGAHIPGRRGRACSPWRAVRDCVRAALCSPAAEEGSDCSIHKEAVARLVRRTGTATGDDNQLSVLLVGGRLGVNPRDLCLLA